MDYFLKEEHSNLFQRNKMTVVAHKIQHTEIVCVETLKKYPVGGGKQIRPTFILKLQNCKGNFVSCLVQVTSFYSPYVLKSTNRLKARVGANGY